AKGRPDPTRAAPVRTPDDLQRGGEIMPHRVLHRSISILVSLPGDDQIDYHGRRLTLTVLRVSARADYATWQVRGTVGNGSGPVVLYRRDPVIPDNVRQRLDALAESVIPA